MASSAKSTSRAALLLLLGLTGAARAGADAAPDLSMGALKQLSVEQLLNLEVTSVSRQPEKLLEAPAAIQVVTGDEIRRFGASSLPEALQLADNLDVAQKNAHDWAISARGFNAALGNKLLVLIDGRTVYTPLFSGVFWDAQSALLEDIDRIEVISGPGGTLWGANAVNGVINITSKPAQDTQGLYLEGGGGSELRAFEGGRYGGTLAPGVAYRVYGQYAEREGEGLPGGATANDAWWVGQGGFRVDAGATPDATATLQGDAYDGRENLQTGAAARISGENLVGRWSRTFSADANLSLQAYFDHTYLADPIPALNSIERAPAGFVTDGLDTYDLDFQDHFALGERNHVVWGLGYRHTRDVVLNAPALAFLPSTLAQDLYSAFLQDEFALSPVLDLTAGTKIEHNDYTGREWEPNVRLRWDLAPRQMAWAAVSRAVRAPSRIDRDLREPATAPLPLLEGSPNFISETVIAYELGYRAQLGSAVTTSVSAFYNEYSHIRSTGFTPGTILPLFFANNVAGNTHGLEFNTSYQALPWWRLGAGYDLLKENLGVVPGQVDLNNALNETSDPEHQLFLTSSMDLPHEVTLDGRLRWIDTLHANNGATVGTVPSYWELGLRLAWRPLPHLELSVVGQNLLHPQHVEYGFPSPTREEIERSCYGKASWRY